MHSTIKTRPIPALRWWVAGLLFASTVINYVDRQTLSLLAPYLKLDYHWTNTQLGGELVLGFADLIQHLVEPFRRHLLARRHRPQHVHQHSEVIGVMPATFQFPARDQRFWAPITTNRYWEDPALTNTDPRHSSGFYQRFLQ